MIHCKTAKLFEAAARLGRHSRRRARQASEEALARYGMHLGTAFQLIDDVLDYSGDEAQTGKHLGDDLAEGKPTLPLILCHAAWHRRAGRRGARTPSSTADVDKFAAVLAVIRDTGALEFTRAQAAGAKPTRRARRSQSCRIQITSECLLELADFAVDAAIIEARHALTFVQCIAAGSAASPDAGP